MGDILETEIMVLLQMPAEPDQFVWCSHPAQFNHGGLLSGMVLPCAVSCVLLHLTLFYCSFFTSFSSYADAAVCSDLLHAHIRLKKHPRFFAIATSPDFK